MKRKERTKSRKHRIIDWLISRWMPQKDGKPLYRLSKIRGPYRMKMKQATPEQVEEGKELVRKLSDPAERR